MTDYLETQVDKFTFRVAKDRKYNSAGIWALLEGTAVRVGLSDFVQQTSGDIAFADVQPAGTMLEVGEVFSEIETIKVDMDILSPLGGKIVKVNPIMATVPETINLDPYRDGWICEIEPSDFENDWNNLLDPEAYFIEMKHQAEEELKKNG